MEHAVHTPARNHRSLFHPKHCAHSNTIAMAMILLVGAYHVTNGLQQSILAQGLNSRTQLVNLRSNLCKQRQLLLEGAVLHCTWCPLSALAEQRLMPQKSSLGSDCPLQKRQWEQLMHSFTLCLCEGDEQTKCRPVSVEKQIWAVQLLFEQCSLNQLTSNTNTFFMLCVACRYLQMHMHLIRQLCLTKPDRSIVCITATETLT